ncbi:MAG: transposase [Syntrophales bacterium LBB04]|nr:transposase [Syntrophales bacterium LBB04]
MPRKARIDATGTVHHVIGRGIDRAVIFRNDRDRDDFLRRLSGILHETYTCCYAWVLMPNHFHLLLKTGRVPIAQVMRRLLTGYAVSYNRHNRRSGHVFQNRYKSILCDEEPYLLELVRYVHLNPIRAGLVSGMEALDGYRYSGHRAIIGNDTRDWQETEAVLRLFSATRSVARKRYRYFVEKGMPQGRREDLIGGGLIRSVGGWSAVQALRRNHVVQKSDERILGGGHFVERVLKEAEERMEHRLSLQALGVDLDRVIRRACEITGCPEQEVQTPGKDARRVKARSLLCYWAVRELGLSQADLVRRLRLSPAGISLSVKRGEDLVQQLDCSLVKAGCKLKN